MDITEINLLSYDLRVISYADQNDSSMIPARQFNIKFGGDSNPNMEMLLKDMIIMNAIRGSTNPGVKEAFEQLLTVMAITQ